MIEVIEDNFRKIFLAFFFVIGLLALFNAVYPLAIFSFYICGAVVVYTVLYPTDPVSLQEDKRAKQRRDLKNKFQAALNAQKLEVDEQSSLSILECVNSNPPTFNFSSRQAGATAEAITKVCEVVAPVFDSSRYEIEEYQDTENKMLSYNITFFKGYPWTNLDKIKPNYKQLLKHQPTYKSIPVGLFESGEVASISFDNRNMLVGGLPRSGKSVFLSVIIAGLCQCEHERIIIFSPKMLDFINYKKRAELYSSSETILNCLLSLDEEVERRKKHCQAKQIKKIEHFKKYLPHIVVIVDEYAVIRSWKTKTDDGKKERKIGEEIERELLKIVSQAGFAGIQVCLTSQRLSSQVISTDLRDLVAGNLISFANGSSTSDEMIFGEFAEFAKASKIPIDSKGVGYLYIEGETPTPKPFKSAFLTSEEEQAIAKKTEYLTPKEYKK